MTNSIGVGDVETIVGIDETTDNETANTDPVGEVIFKKVVYSCDCGDPDCVCMRRVKQPGMCCECARGNHKYQEY